MSLGPVRLEPSFHERVWGAKVLGPWYPDAKKPTGEVWFPSGDLLVKFIFTADRLSVQVHPDDDYAMRVEGSPGKTEMWYVLRAEPGAEIATGFRQSVTREQVREAALSGEIEDMLQWWPVQAGDVFFIPAGTVHAIGGGLVLCEIQQNSDLTYRLYDYGRPRPLHLDKALDVATLGPHPGPSRAAGAGRLAECPYFTADLRVVTAPEDYTAESGSLLIVLDGCGSLATQPVQTGQVWLTPPGALPARLCPTGWLLLLEIFPPSSGSASSAPLAVSLLSVSRYPARRPAPAAPRKRGRSTPSSRRKPADH